MALRDVHATAPRAGTTMRAIVLQKGDAAPRLAHLPLPRARPGEALCRTLRVGLDGTDEEVVKGAARFPTGEDRLVLGHECLAEVIAAPEGAPIAAGDLVAPLVRHGCGACEACARGASDMCPTGDYLEHGIKGLDGFLREQWADDASTLVRLPRELGSLGVLTEPLSIAVKALDEARLIQRRVPWFDPEEGFRGRRALVIGSGSLGSLACLLLAREGARVWVADRSGPDTAAARLLREVGVRHVDARETPTPQLADEVGGFDVVLEATGAARVAFDGMRALAGNGILLLLGVPPGGGRFEVPGAEIHRDLVMGNQVVLGSVNSGRRHFEEAARALLDFRRKWGDLPDRLVTHEYPPEEVAQALDENGDDVVKKVVVWEG